MNLKYMEKMGENLKLARKRRRLTMEIICQRANISRTTLSLIEKGNPSVSMGAYFNVLRAMNLHADIEKIAGDDIVGKKLQDVFLLDK